MWVVIALHWHEENNDCIEGNIKRIKEKGRRDGERERDGQKI